jgi:hypothetical protein
LQELIVYQGPFVRGLDSLAFALVRATTYVHHRSHDEQEFVNSERIRHRLVLKSYITVRTPLVAKAKIYLVACLPAFH